MSEHSTSVRTLRAQYQRDAPHLRATQLLVSVTALLKQHPLEQSAPDILRLCIGTIGCQHACLLRYQAGRLHCLASIGHAPPAQLKMPVYRPLQALLKAPATPMWRQPIEQPWVFMQGDYDYEWLIPLQYGGQVTGLLCFAATQGLSAPLNDELKSMLDSLACLLAGLWSENTPKRKLSDSAALDLQQLSPREREIMALLPKGMNNQRIADHLGIGRGTVKTHIEHILHKLQLEDRAQAAARAVELRLGSS
jgi:DNA-binding CsgD family transcriptional regulator